MHYRQSTEAIWLRAQALALLQRAQEIDGLHPYLIHHSHEYGHTGYLVWAPGPELSQEAAECALESSFEPNKDEFLDIQSGVSLKEVVGIDVGKRLPIASDDKPVDADRTETA